MLNALVYHLRGTFPSSPASIHFASLLSLSQALDDPSKASRHATGVSIDRDVYDFVGAMFTLAEAADDLGDYEKDKRNHAYNIYAMLEHHFGGMQVFLCLQWSAMTLRLLENDAPREFLKFVDEVGGRYYKLLKKVPAHVVDHHYARLHDWDQSEDYVDFVKKALKRFIPTV